MSPEPDQPPSTPARTALCPYCGHQSANLTACDRCRGLFEPLSRQASQNTMGPWFIRDEANPFRPGCSYQTLRTLVERGRVQATTILRGPSTRQFWCLASRTPGVAHLLGACHACQAKVSASAESCPACGTPFIVSADRQHLGLADIRLIPGQSSAEQIAATMRPRPAGDQAISLDAAPTSASFSLPPPAVARPLGPAPAPTIPLDAVPASPAAEAPDNAWDRAIRRTRQGAGQGDDRDPPGSMHRAIVISLMALAGAGMLLSGLAFAFSITNVLNAPRVAAAGPAAATAPAPAAPSSVPAPAKTAE